MVNPAAAKAVRAKAVDAGRDGDTQLSVGEYDLSIKALSTLEGVEAARIWNSHEEAFIAELRLLARIMRGWPGGVSIMAASANMDDWLLQENLLRRLTMRGRALKVEEEREAATARKAATAAAAATDASAGAGVSSPAASNNNSAAMSEMEKELEETKKREAALQKKLDAAKSSGARNNARGGGNGRGANGRGANGRGANGRGNDGGRGKGKGKGNGQPTVAPMKDDGFQVVDNKGKNKKRNKKK
jgi:hypothetical protein